MRMPGLPLLGRIIGHSILVRFIPGQNMESGLSQVVSHCPYGFLVVSPGLDLVKETAHITVALFLCGHGNCVPSLDERPFQI